MKNPFLKGDESAEGLDDSPSSALNGDLSTNSVAMKETEEVSIQQKPLLAVKEVRGRIFFLL